MEIRKKLKRWLKLGFFVGAGTAAAVLSACDSGAKKIDTGPPKDTATADAGKADSGAADAAADTGKGTADKAAPTPDKKSGWDIPLE